jgi:hypothetical protein
VRSRLGLVGISLLFVASACGEPTRPTQTLPTTPTISVSPSPSLSPLPSPTPTAWQNYSNEEFDFSIDYPPGFLFEEASKGVTSNADKAGRLAFVRFFDQKFAAGDLAGQVELAVFTKDADSLESWLAKHSSDDYPDDSQVYYNQVSNQASTTVNNRSAISFDWKAAEIGPVHVVAFFIDGRVFQIDWFGDDPTYAGTIEPIFDRMLESFEG